MIYYQNNQSKIYYCYQPMIYYCSSRWYITKTISRRYIIGQSADDIIIVGGWYTITAIRGWYIITVSRGYYYSRWMVYYCCSRWYYYSRWMIYYYNDAAIVKGYTIAAVDGIITAVDDILLQSVDNNITVSRWYYYSRWIIYYCCSQRMIYYPSQSMIYYSSSGGYIITVVHDILFQR